MINLIKKHKIKAFLIGFITLFDALIISLALIPSNKDITAPGGLTEVVSVIKADSEIDLKGSFNTIYVYSIERSSILQSMIAGLANFNEIKDSSKYFHLTPEENNASGIIYKNQSIEASIIYAYKYAASKGYDNIKLNSKLLGLIVCDYQINNKLFKMGDIITAIYDKDKNQTFDIKNNPNELYNILYYQERYISIGDVITYIRNGIEDRIEIKENFSYESAKNRFYVLPKYELDNKSAVPKYELFASKTHGPSGGFLQTLSIYSQITNKDYTYGKKIVGTGTIDVGGNVGAIGGISQKVVTAIYNNADVFFCPLANAKEGQETYDNTLGHEKMKFVVVSTFKDAIEWLEKEYEH